MNARALRLFYAGCGVLLLLIGLAWLPGAPPEPPAVLRPPRSGAGEPAGGPPVTHNYERIAETILARPLFTIGRRPHQEPARGNRFAGDGIPRLSGIMITPYGKRAIFMPDGGKPMVLAVGASIGDHTIRAIDRDGVVLDGVAQKLHPTLDRQRTGPLTPNILPGFQPQPFVPPNFNPAFPQGQPAGEDGNAPPNVPPPQPFTPPFRGPFPHGRE